jgi:hypothetical protein
MKTCRENSNFVSHSKITGTADSDICNVTVQRTHCCAFVTSLSISITLLAVTCPSSVGRACIVAFVW